MNSLITIYFLNKIKNDIFFKIPQIKIPAYKHTFNAPGKIQ